MQVFIRKEEIRFVWKPKQSLDILGTNMLTRQPIYLLFNSLLILLAYIDC